MPQTAALEGSCAGEACAIVHNLWHCMPYAYAFMRYKCAVHAGQVHTVPSVSLKQFPVLTAGRPCDAMR